jgi:hypothetical protein
MRLLSYHEQRFIGCLQRERVRFLVVGSWALALHGVSVDPDDIDMLIGTDSDNTRSFLRAWALAEPQPIVRCLDGPVEAGIQERVILGPSHADVLTTIVGINFDDALQRAATFLVEGFSLPVVGRDDLESILQASDRPRDSERLAHLRSLRYA